MNNKKPTWRHEGVRHVGFCGTKSEQNQQRRPSGTGSLLIRKGQELLSAYEQFENAAKENMEKRHDTYLRLVIRSSGTRNG